MIKENCFAFRSLPKEKNGIRWAEERCDALTEFVCDRKQCPFYKDKNTLERYNIKVGNTWVTAYRRKDEREILPFKV